MKRVIKENTVYRHYKGDLYRVIKVAYDTEKKVLKSAEDVDDSVKMVVYKPVVPTALGPDVWWVRPYAMFVENVVINGKEQPRFQEVTEVS